MSRRRPDRLARAFVADLTEAGPALQPVDETVVDAREIADLPEPVQRYLSFMRVVGAPRVWSFRVAFTGRFRLRPGMPWLHADAWQYNSAIETTRVFTMRLRAARVVTMLGHDTYVHGRGRMVGRLMGVVKVADGSGEEFDIGELTTWLDDAIMLAPSMLLDDRSTWSDAGPNAFEIRRRDHDREVAATVTIDERGAPVEFSTTDRYAALPNGLVQARWFTPALRWDPSGSVPFPQPADAVWELPEGNFTYVRGGFVRNTFACNVPPPNDPHELLR